MIHARSVPHVSLLNTRSNHVGAVQGHDRVHAADAARVRSDRAERLPTHIGAKGMLPHSHRAFVKRVVHSVCTTPLCPRSRTERPGLCCHDRWSFFAKQSSQTWSRCTSRNLHVSCESMRWSRAKSCSRRDKAWTVRLLACLHTHPVRRDT